MIPLAAATINISDGFGVHGTPSERRNFSDDVGTHRETQALEMHCESKLQNNTYEKKSGLK